MDRLIAGGASDIFNLGSGIGYSNMEILECARRISGHPIPARMAERRPGDPARLVASAEKAKAVLGWKPVCSDLETIVATAWNWHKDHPNGYGK